MTEIINPFHKSHWIKMSCWINSQSLANKRGLCLHWCLGVGVLVIPWEFHELWFCLSLNHRNIILSLVYNCSHWYLYSCSIIFPEWGSVLVTDISDLSISLHLFSYNPIKKLLSRSPLPFFRLSWMGLLNVRNLSKLDLSPLDKLILRNTVLGFSNSLQRHYIKCKFL